MKSQIYALVSGAVSFDVVWGKLGEFSSTPRARFHRVSGSTDYTMAGPGTKTATVRIDVFGKTALEAETALAQIEAVLSEYSGGNIQGVFWSDGPDGFEDDVSILDRASATISVSYRD